MSLTPRHFFTSWTIIFSLPPSPVSAESGRDIGLVCGSSSVTVTLLLFWSMIYRLGRGRVVVSLWSWNKKEGGVVGMWRQEGAQVQREVCGVHHSHSDSELLSLRYRRQSNTSLMLRFDEGACFLFTKIYMRSRRCYYHPGRWKMEESSSCPGRGR
jgi:hypothetical protein